MGTLVHEGGTYVITNDALVRNSIEVDLASEDVTYLVPNRELPDILWSADDLSFHHTTWLIDIKTIDVEILECVEKSIYDRATDLGELVMERIQGRIWLVGTHPLIERFIGRLASFRERVQD